MTVTKKLVGAFGLVFVFIALFGVYILYAFQDLTEERLNVRDWLGAEAAVSKIDKSINRIQRLLYMDAVNQTQSDIQQEISAVDKLFADYQAVLDNSVYDDEAERQADQAMIDNEKILWSEYKSKIAQGNLQETEISYKKFAAAMNEDDEQCVDGLEKAVEVSENTFAEFENLVHIMVWIIGAILIFVVGILYFLAKDIRQSVRQIVSATESAANGDLSKDIVTDSADEFGTIAEQVNAVIQHMRKTLSKMQSAAEELSASVEKTKSGVSHTGQLLEDVAMTVTTATDNTKDQKEFLRDTEERIKQMEVSVEQSIAAMKAGLWSLEQTAEFAYRGMEMSDVTVKKMEEIAQSVDDTAKIVEELGENSKEITSIVEVISGISEQTNLLALNAAIEAARAGEHGRGFAVVADEVRKLAESSQQSVQKIGDIVGTIQATTNRAVETMQSGHRLVQEGQEDVGNTVSSFHEIVNMLQQTDENSQQVMNMINDLYKPIKDIVNRTEKISNMSVEIASKMETISIATAEQAENIINISEDSKSLSDLSENMKNTVHEFQL